MGQATRAEQIRIYLGKHIRLFKNEYGWKSLISALIISLIISSVLQEDMFVVAWQTRNGAFVLICACIWIGIFNSIQSVCKERDIVKREHRSGLHMSSYIMSHMIFDAVLCIAEAFIVSVVTLVSRQNNYPAYGVLLPGILENYISFLLLIYSADLLGLMVSSIVKTPSSAMTVMPFVLIFELVLSGFIFELEGTMSKVAAFTTSKWGLNALCITANVNDMPDAFESYFSDYEFLSSNLLKNWGVLLLFVFLYALLSIISLQFIDRDKR